MPKEPEKVLVENWVSSTYRVVKEVFKFRSVNNIVIAPASTGRDRSSKIAVIKTAQGNKGIRSINIPNVRRLRIVVIKFTAPNKDEIPAKCKLKIVKSTEAPPWNINELRGGYTVQPVPAPVSTRDPTRRRNKAGTNSQYLILFKRGKAISGDPIINGTNQLPKHPIKIGITIKKIIIKACAVTITLYNCSLQRNPEGNES